MSDVGRQVDPDKGHLNRERQVTTPLELPSCIGKSASLFLSELERRVRDGVYRETGWQVWWQGIIRETEN